MNFCSTCQPGRMCPPCVSTWLRLHAKNARVIGEQWADRVVTTLHARGEALQDWPEFDESDRLRSVAVEKMKHLAGADPAAREALAGPVRMRRG